MMFRSRNRAIKRGHLIVKIETKTALDQPPVFTIWRKLRNRCKDHDADGARFLDNAGNMCRYELHDRVSRLSAKLAESATVY